MASKLLSSITGGGGVFTPSALVSDRLAVGLTGTLLSVAEVGGVTYKINHLLAGTAAAQGGISLIVDGVTLHSAVSLAGANGSAEASTTAFAVANSLGTSALSISYARIYRSITCKSFSILKNAGNTTEAIDYAYEVGSIK